MCNIYDQFLIHNRYKSLWKLDPTDKDVYEYLGSTWYLPEDVQVYSGVNLNKDYFKTHIHKLIELNDIGCSPSVLATYIEDNL